MLDYGSADGMRWLSGQNVAEFIVLDDGRPIICRVSQECLEDNCGCPPAPATLLGAAKDNFNHITDRIGKLISLGRFEADGTILLESSDWQENRSVVLRKRSFAGLPELWANLD